MNNMKNMIALLLVLTLTLGLTSCGFKSTGTDISGEAENDNNGAFSSSENTIYGKITAITGNEMEIALAKKTEPEDETEDLKDATPVSPGKNDMPVINGEIENDSGDIEFTGETISLTVPAGIKIYSMGQEINMSDLKKGDMVSVAFDSDTHDNIISLDKVE